MNRYFHLTNPWWENKKFNCGITRSKYLNILKKDFDQKLIQILTGVRRVGKSTVVLQLIQFLITKQKINPKKILFFSIEEPSIAQTPIINIINQFRAQHNLKSNTKIYVFIDEIQFRNSWQQEIKSIYDSENTKFIITGSAAILLSKQLSLLTGRYLKTQVFPLNFKEYLKFKKVTISKADEFLLQKQLEQFLLEGGMPEYVLNKTDRYLETTVESMLFKDLVIRFTLRNPTMLLNLIYLLSDRVGSTSSSLKLANILEVNKDTTLTYLSYLNQTFIISELPNYSTSRNKEIYNPPKFYFEDTGILNKYSSKSNIGALAENAIYNHLKVNLHNQLRIKLGYWHESKSEIDFIVSKNQNLYLIESKWVDKLEQVNLKPLEKALKNTVFNQITYVTKNLKAKVNINHHQVIFTPLRDFLLNPLQYSLCKEYL